MDKIFVAIAALNEPFLRQTVLSALWSADHPENLSFGIFVHDTDGYRDHGLDEIDAEIRVLQSVGTTHLGFGLSRLNSSALRNYTENFYLQADAHLIFRKGWDTTLIRRYRQLQEVTDKPVISMQGPLWTYADGVISDLYGTEIDPYNFTDHHDDLWNAALVQSADILNRFGDDIKDGLLCFGDFMQADIMTGQFVFSETSFFEEVGNDPLVTLLGDETTMAMRAWTRGYRIFAIKDIVFLHLDKTHSPELNWKFAYELESNPKRDDHGLERVKAIMTGQLLGYYGAPSMELLEAFDAQFPHSLIKYFGERLYAPEVVNSHDSYASIGRLLNPKL
jgi:hypothetical protein